MKAKTAIKDLRKMVEAARGLAGAEASIAAQLLIDLLISADFSSNALSAATFEKLLRHRLQRHRAQPTSVSHAVH